MDNFVAVSLRDELAAISFAHLECSLSLSRLQGEVKRLLQNLTSHSWVNHVNNKDYSGGWDVLPLRCQAQHLHAHPILQGFSIATGDTWENVPAMAQYPEIQHIFNQLHCPLKAARLMRLKAAAHIKPHRDHGLSIEFGEARLHLPILTNTDVNFVVNRKTVPMSAGELWYFNADQIHEVYNRSNEDRINLVIDCVANEWLREQIRASTKRE